MDQDTFADLSANVSRISAELEQMHRDIAELAEAGRRIYRHLALHDASWENRQEWEAWVETLGMIGQRNRPETPAPPLYNLIDDPAVRLWTQWSLDQEPLVSWNSRGLACYEVILTTEHPRADHNQPVMVAQDGQGYHPDELPDSYWVGVPGYRRDHTLEAMAEQAGWRREPNEDETDETY